MPKYVIRSGKHRVGDEVFKAGDVIELESVPEAFKDRFEFVPEPVKSTTAQPTQPTQLTQPAKLAAGNK